MTNLFDPRVAIYRTPESAYSDSSMRDGVAALGELMNWSEPGRGPLGGIIQPGAKVLVKPNLVLHRNEGGGGIDELLTHGTLIRSVVEAALTAGAHVIVGDAPLQSCDFGEMLSRLKLDDWAAGLQSREPRFGGIFDFRRTICVMRAGVRLAEENVQPEDLFRIFDLGSESLLEPISGESDGDFRVSWYDPRAMKNTHHAGRHQYLVARQVLDAGVVINLPKLKTHKKAGITCALKNLIGINGNKEYLPHHRFGGSERGGDCYPGRNPLKLTLEHLADRQNMAGSYAAGAVLGGVSSILKRIVILQGDRYGIEGSWSGNDTIWRTCLDLNRILHYGRLDGTMSGEVQRRVIHIADGVVAGQGDGPLSPEPLRLGLLLASANPAVMDWAGARLLGYDPHKVPLTREAFGQFRWPLTSFDHRSVSVLGAFGAGAADELIGAPSEPVKYPSGWRGASARASADFAARS